MSDYDKLISAGNVDLHPEYLAEIFKTAAEQSSVLRLGTQLRNMTTREMKLKVSTALPEVYFVGTKGTSQSFPADALKKTTESEWDDVSMYAGELAAIIVIPNNVFNDADFDVWGEVKAQLPSAIARKIDQAVIYGTAGVDVPDDWSDGIWTDMPLEHIIPAGAGDLYDDLLGAMPSVFAAVEEDGYDVNGAIASVTMKADLRGLRDAAGTGMPIFSMPVQGTVDYALAGVPLSFPKNGAIDPTILLLLAGDWSKLVYSIRQDVSVDVFTTGVVQDEQGAITHNLMQEDLTAIRCTFRMGWALPEPVGYFCPASGTMYPFAAYTG
jgi:HK97 family phage major capsid protein